MTTRDPDVLIIGGGPAGATAAAVLSQRGRRVRLLERARFPRYHVGESLMPHCWYTLDRIGALDRVRAAGFPSKYSVQFVRQSGEVSTPFYFFEHRDHPSSTTWQVVRSEFDAILLDTARGAGAEVHEGAQVTELLTDARGATVGLRARDEAGRVTEHHAPITIDATGRDAFAAVRRGWRVRDEKLDKVAVWTYYRGALRDPGLDEGATTVAYLPGKGWFWYIPLPGDLVSVGVVAERDYLFDGTRDLEAIFQREVPKNAWIARHVAPGRVERFGARDGDSAYRVTGEFSYRARHCAADGLVLVGDAFAFLDPIFSSGVLLALKSGELSGDAVDAALAAGDVSAGRFAAYGDTMRLGVETMRQLVYAFYDQDFSFRKVIAADPSLRGELTDCLIGDFFRQCTPLFDTVARFAALPAPIAHGGPLIPAVDPTAAAG